MGGSGKLFTRRSKPRGLLLSVGLSCLAVYVLVSLITWGRGSTQRGAARARHQYIAPHRGGREIRNRTQVLERAEAKRDVQPSSQVKPGGRNSLLDPKYRNFKTILYWNDAYGRKDFSYGVGQEPFLAANCQVKECYATPDRQLVHPEEADAVLWHLRSNDKTLPSVRSPHTFYTFWVIESALYTYGNLNIYNGVFNWTMTYRLDSDFPRPYGRINPPPPNATLQVVQPRNYAAGKTKLAAWFVSNCNTVSDREHLMTTLQQYVTVDTYGGCGALKCSREKSTACLQMLQADYKFYFALENSLCMDYITEKFFDTIKYDVVMVVYGLGYHKLNLPKHSYIDVTDFSSVRHLAAYLRYLDSNDTAYNEYFRWKELGYSVVDQTVVRQQALCDLCARLHEAHVPTAPQGGATTRQGALSNHNSAAAATFHPPLIKEAYRKVYTKLHEWFVTDQCTEPYTNQNLAAFIHGKAVSREQLAAEEEELPFLLRSNQAS